MRGGEDPDFLLATLGTLTRAWLFAVRDLSRKKAGEERSGFLATLGMTRVGLPKEMREMK